MESRHVLITGAAGFIGGACVKEFVGRGWHATALVHRRSNERLDNLERNGQVDILRASISNRDELFRVLRQYSQKTGIKFDAIVNCAGRASDIGSDRLFREANLRGVENLIECVREFHIGRLVQISTTDVYGISDFTNLAEDAPLANNRRNPYPKYKILAEKLIRANLLPEKYVILRPAAVWGPGDTTLMPRILSFLKSTPVIIHFGKWKGRNVWHLAYIENVARMAYAATISDEALGNAFNVADREKTTIDEYYRMLLSVFFPGKNIRSVTLPF